MAIFAISRLLVATSFATSAICMASTSVSFASVFIGNSVVLQAGTSRVWGNASSGDVVELSIDGVPAGKVDANATGRWEATLTHGPSWSSEIRATVGGSAVTTTVRFGLVMLCSGQSNMQLNLVQLANGTEEAAAAGAYTGRISLMSLQAPEKTQPPWNGTTAAPQWNAVSPGPDGTTSPFSGLCWLTGKALFEAWAGAVPVGLISAAVGGTPIEAWLPPGVLGAACPSDEPPCGGSPDDSSLWAAFVAPFAPLALGAALWDQGERDVHCMPPATNRTAQYPCMEAALVRTWRAAFRSEFAFAAVQLPGYLGDCSERNGTYFNCVPGVFNMRLAQAAGVAASPNASWVPTYDLSCPYGVKTPACPLGSVHNINKTVVAARAARALLSALDPGRFPAAGAAPPLVQAVTATPAAGPAGTWVVTASFNAAALALRDTQFCVVCCAGAQGSAGGGDFDVSADGGATWVNGTSIQLAAGGEGAGDAASSAGVTFTVAGLSGPPVLARYTANQAFPQCAVIGLGNGLPAGPFEVPVTVSAE